MKPDWGCNHFFDCFFNLPFAPCMSFFCPKSVFAFGVRYSFFVECFFTVSKCSLHIFLRGEQIQWQNQRAHSISLQPNRVKKKKRKPSRKRLTSLVSEKLRWVQMLTEIWKKIKNSWKTKACSKTNKPCRQKRVKGCRCGLNTHIWVTHRHTHRPFVYWETCTLNQHFFVMGEP